MFNASGNLWARTVDFHGHACPGLAIGFRMVMAAIAYLGLETASEDEEIVCVSECDACCVDAAQAILGCTLGKGNLLLKPRGKAAMTFYQRSNGKGCRVLWLGAGDPDLGRDEKIRLLLSEASAGLLTLSEAAGPVPPKAGLSKSLACAACGERAAEAMMRPHKGELLCLDCWPNQSRILP